MHHSRRHDEESSSEKNRQVRKIPIVVANTLKVMIVIVNTKMEVMVKEKGEDKKALSASTMKRKVLRSNGPLMQ